ncbi:lytic polysaccharide monooxygenase [Venturia nashicola]|uniref:lytic cellulose monooxygenase (C4-dehydrogenating) n=1 Tax=Venturia nashicola TaxID=86259 RepID=A0A4Z1NU96_9PEZI|nr:lytic polysaccharide monooxygenase [Venturia nashicola]TLD27760.1 lytic polysaccharide monooxygenase [Venturia nashicola]
MKLSLLILVGATGLASAHYTFTNLIVNGNKSGYYQYIRINNNHWSHGSVQDVNSNDMRCGGEMIFPSNASTKTVIAGTTVGFRVEGGLAHPGPLQFYMAQAPAGQNLSSWNGTGKVWFKIAGDPPKVNASGLTWPQQFATEVSVKVPPSLPIGNYLLRAEQIALHGASQIGGAQLYIQCAQLAITGTGKGVPSPKVTFPGAYKATDAGILMQLYYPVPTNYTMPGPAIWQG